MSSDSSPDQPGLEHDSILRVDKSVSLTIGSDSLLIVDDRPRRSGRGCCGLRRSETTKLPHAISLYNILDVQAEPSNLTITYAASSSKEDVTVSTLHYSVNDKECPTVDGWAKKLLDLAYGNVPRSRRLKILINPFGGQGKAAALYQREAAPIFAAAGCKLDVQTTEHRGHAIEIAEQIDVNAYDAIVCCSGDGLPYEVFNGLGKRPNAREALAKLPVALLPCGSGNAMTWSCFGTGSVSVAALAVVKGLRTPLDLMSISQKGSRTLSFLSTSFGIVAESDLGTDNIRWMGAQRFTYGYLARVLANRVWPCNLAIKVEIDDKEAIKEHYAGYTGRELDPFADAHRIEAAEKSPALPDLQYGGVDDGIPRDWEVVPGENMGNFYAGNMSVVTKDANFFPAALPNDGFMDILTVDGTISRLTSLGMISEVATGGFFYRPEVKIRKATAFRLVPHQKEGYISIDGESIPFEALQVEIHPGLGTVLSKSGTRYEADGPM
ncbi:hypothetical protein N7520_010082 [Penicillium odoratum]|uniref:uncharacterized protein n=1 Tax=Penicillium odoratum TaxID=1167516 RepID=UPI002547EBDA|nr:uncharacterized protein N7520_010082 [Penicillium odoratum]KAJ5753165.1 hypothetical protein N7520_010082 [Penicillium odoratum]